MWPTAGLIYFTGFTHSLISLLHLHPPAIIKHITQACRRVNKISQFGGYSLFFSSPPTPDFATGENLTNVTKIQAAGVEATTKKNVDNRPGTSGSSGWQPRMGSTKPNMLDPLPVILTMQRFEASLVLNTDNSLEIHYSNWKRQSGRTALEK